MLNSDFLKITISILVVTLNCAISDAQTKPKEADKFTVVIDPGHGAEAIGTAGNSRYPGVYEKHINLAVGLMVRDMIKDNASDVRVLMTRTTDSNPSFKYRTDLATKNNADLLVSIHCNAMPDHNRGQTYGALTVVMSLDKNDKNANIAKLENSDMLLEENYKEVYKGFDPNNPQSAIGLGIYQNDRLRLSIEAAILVQNQLEKIGGRVNKGVIQLSDIWLVWASTSPTILIELGFLSNKAEEDFLHSKKGQELMAKSVYQGIMDYKTRFYDQRHQLGYSGEASTVALPPPFAVENNPEQPSQDITKGTDNETNDTNKSSVRYTVQLTTSPTALNSKTNVLLKKFDKVEYYKEAKTFKYTTERVPTFAQVKKLLSDASRKGATGAFIVAFDGESKITVNRARELTGE